ncbi:hypothetical protein [Puniceibacterium confluentis]|uniref:hypothetical protein n=1 Tax=Puniceibacterium confluentis TaxID=1958944 RepID=UPI0011B47818|nr:hypothetical protein [Puniceibacterium confluentis]
MIQRIIGAGARAFMVAMLIALPALTLRGVSADTTQMVALLALLAALLTFVEYYSLYPSVIEFRNAPPFNRLRFVALFLTVVLLTAISHGVTDPTLLSQTLTNIGARIGAAMDFPFSPVRLMVLLVPHDAPLAVLEKVRTHAGLAYLISFSSMLIFVALVRVLNWPIRKGAFNFWVNLPLFDPTAGGDVIFRLKRDAHVNVALGFLLPFLIPAVMKAATGIADPISLSDPQTLIWTMTAWAFLPASLMMRGIALSRIAELIEEKRRRAYAQTEYQAA